MNGDARLAVGAVVNVDLDVLPLLVAEGSVEEEIHYPFHIVTEHHCWFPSVGHVVTTSYSFGTQLPNGEFRAVSASELWPRRRRAGRLLIVLMEVSGPKFTSGRPYCNRAARNGGADAERQKKGGPKPAFLE
jgi:hypothetical protein